MSKYILQNKLALKCKKIKVVLPGALKLNQQCHKNSVHYALKNEELKIAMVWYKYRVGENNWNLHFLNVDRDGNFTDNTCGEWVQGIDYRFIKMVYYQDYMRINHIFKQTCVNIHRKQSYLTRIFNDDTY